MLHVVRPNGIIEEVAEAETGTVEGDRLICRDPSGRVVKTFDHLEVIMFGQLESVRKGLVSQMANEAAGP